MSIHKRVEQSIPFDALHFAQQFLEAIDTPRALTVSMLLSSGEHRQAVELEIDQRHYDDAAQFFSDYQATKLVSKLPGLRTGIDTEQVAYEKFLQAEESCRETNNRFRDGSYLDSNPGVINAILFGAARKIASILGPVPSLSDMDFSFGPGAAYGVRKETSAYHKVSADLECTYAMIGYLPEFLEEFPGWIREDQVDVKPIPGSQLTFVPKNAKTDRAICIEPLLNGLHQKGVGSYLRGRLKRHGVSLDDQGVNQRLAQQALTSGLATVDFSSASDTIAYSLVLELLPIDWFEFLDVSRCPRFEYQGTWHSFQKFSSMGNAYTFELESLIFYGLAYATLEHLGIQPQTGVNLSVYGDDVIIPQAAFLLYEQVSKHCGFTVNTSKSFASGRFFESCGHDYFDGKFVRPILLTKQFQSLGSSYYACNSIIRFAERLKKLVSWPSSSYVYGALARCRHRYWKLVACIPVKDRLTGPEFFGDGHLICPLAAARTYQRADSASWDGWWFKTRVERPLKTDVEHVPSAYALYGTRLRNPPKGVHLGWEPIANDSGNWYVTRNKTRVDAKLVFCPSVWFSPTARFWD